MIKRALMAAAVVAIAGSASGQILSVTDDLTDGLFDAFFSYDLSSDFAGNGVGGDFNELGASGLLLASDEVLITFPGAAGGNVLEVNISFIDFTGVGATEFEAIGLGGMANDANTTVGQLESFHASSSSIGFIQSAQVGAFETYIKSITVRYEVPAPAGTAVLGLAGLGAMRRRR